MITLGITGGIGMGKSTSYQILIDLGIPVVDTDVLSKRLTSPGSPETLEIGRLFGSEFLTQQQELRRDIVAEKAFSNPELRGKLEALLHPRIRAEWVAFLHQAQTGGARVAAVVIPLLFEKGYENEFTRRICVSCSSISQRTRLLERGWSPEHAELRNRNQWPVSTKMDRSDAVIWTEGSVEMHRRQWLRVLEQL